MHTRAAACVSATALLLGLGGARSARADEPALKVVDHLHVDSDFIDDPFALSPDGAHLAWITTDGATRSQLHVATVGDRKGEKTFAYGSITPERVEFLDAERVLVVERDPESRVARAEVFGPKGSLGKFGPASEVGLGTVGGVPALITWLRGTTAKVTTHTFSAFRRDTLKPLARKVLNENGEGRVAFAGSLYKPLYFLDGYATLVGQKEGAYDKAHDIRKPEVAARADIFSAKLIAEKEIKDLVEFAKFTGARARHNNESVFVRFSDERDQLELFDAGDAVSPLKLPRPLGKYDPETLLYRPAAGGNLIVSLTVDPVNAEAVKAQKTDKDWLDVYHLDVASRALKPLARIDSEKRPTTWAVGGTRFALLRKHKTMGRGGADLDIFDLGEAAADKKPDTAPAARPLEPAAPAAGSKDGAAPAAPATAKDGAPAAPATPPPVPAASKSKAGKRK